MQFDWKKVLLFIAKYSTKIEIIYIKILISPSSASLQTTNKKYIKTFIETEIRDKITDALYYWKLLLLMNRLQNRNTHTSRVL